MNRTSAFESKQEAKKYFGQILRENRLERQMTQEQVAFATGLAPNTISRIELGKVSLMTYTMVLLSNLYELPINVLFGLKGLPDEEKIKLMEKNGIIFFSEDREFMGFGYVISFNPRTYSFTIENLALEKTAKDASGERRPWAENMDDLLDMEIVCSRQNLYEKRLSKLIGKELFLHDKDYSIFLLGRIIKVEGKQTLVKVRHSFCPNEKTSPFV